MDVVCEEVGKRFVSENDVSYCALLPNGRKVHDSVFPAPKMFNSCTSLGGYQDLVVGIAFDIFHGTREKKGIKSGREGGSAGRGREKGRVSAKG